MTLVDGFLWFTCLALFVLIHKNRQDFSELAEAIEEALDSLLETMKGLEVAMLMIKQNKKDIEDLKKSKIWIPKDEEFKINGGLD